MQYKLTNINISKGKTKRDCIKFLGIYCFEIENLVVGIKKLNEILDNGVIIESWLLDKFAEFFYFNSEIIETPQEKYERFHREIEETQLKEANQWYHSLSDEHQAYVRMLAGQFVVVGPATA